MKQESDPISGQVKYSIRVKGYLACDWSEWFDGMTLSHEANGETVITGPVRDQAALHRLLAKVRDLCLTLISLQRIESGENGKIPL